MINQVALVSQTKNVSTAQLVIASAAIQKQVTRDVSPIWDIEATVDSFESLSDVPLGYWQIVIMDKIPYDAQGIHLNRTNGQPFALVEYSDNWALTTSHECLEMLVDPSGNRTATANSVESGQGRVQYLMEICDPSESATFAYTVNGILLSDFYTPHYFDPVESSGTRYSFSGAITKPLEVLDEGYLSWFEPISKHVFQMFVNDGKTKTVDRGEWDSGFGSLRAFSDRLTAKDRKEAEKTAKPKNLLLTGAVSNNKESAYDRSVQAQAESLQSQINGLLGQKTTLKPK
jgi:hypothetical protein